MPLAPGTTLGPYEILAPLGAGGMGEVYRARDTRLGRDVAVKVLPEHVAPNPEARARFEREAKAISSLNHPNICTLHDVGHQEGVDYLVMELVEGETLTERLARGPLPSDEALRVGIQVADALDRAHRQGLVHRDLKPGNVMLTKSGAKVLDFGLARATGLSPTVSDITHSPTVTRPLTAEGTIVGTFQYMAPEQLEGKEADARSDLWALGVLLYEMATGHKAFEGKSQASLIGAIMNTEPPPVSSVSPLAPPALDRVIRACLAKDPEERIQTAHDVKLQLQWIAEGGSLAGVPAPVSARRRRRERATLAVAVVTSTALLVIGVASFFRPSPAPQLIRFEIPPPSSLQFQDSPRISPDGRYIAYNASDSAGVMRIWLKPLEALNAQPLPGTEGAQRPFWSPDSRYLAFIAGGKLKKMEITGAPPVVICDAPSGADGSWGRAGVILYDGTDNDPIMRVSAGGGVPSVAIAPDSARGDRQVGWPEFLPDGRHFFFLGISAHPTLRVGALDSKKLTDLGPCDSQIKYVHPGYVLFSRSGTLVAQRFDVRALKFAGDPVPVAEQVTTNPVGASDFHASENGILVFSTRRAQTGELDQVDREGHLIQTLGCPPTSLHPWISPDGRRIALRALDEQTRTRDLWVVDCQRNVASRFTFDPGNENYPVWAWDGKRILYYSDASGSSGLYAKQLTGSGEKSLLLPWTGNDATCTDWSHDGRFVIFQADDPQTKTDVWVLRLGGDKKAEKFLSGPFNESDGQLSPDGRYLAYTSDESGRNEIYVQTFPDRSDKWLISTRGGSDPKWSSNGRVIYYLSADQHMMSVTVRAGASFEPGTPEPLFAARVLFPTGVRNHYAVAPDDRSFYLIAPGDSRSLPSTMVVVNWMAGIDRK